MGEQYAAADDPLFAEALSFLDQSSREQAQRRREEEEQRNRELMQARALASAKRRQSIVLALLLVGVGAIAFLFYRDVRKNQQITQATAEYQRLSTESQSAQARLRDLEAQEARLKEQIAAAATPEEKARLEQLTRDIEAAKVQAKGSQDELSKLKKDRELSDSDRGRLLNQVDSLQKQLTQVTAERDKLQTQKPDAADGSRRSRAVAEAASGRAQSLGRSDRGNHETEGRTLRGAQERPDTVIRWLIRRLERDGAGLDPRVHRGCARLRPGQLQGIGAIHAGCHWDAVGREAAPEGSADGRHPVRSVRAAVLSRCCALRHEERLRIGAGRAQAGRKRTGASRHSCEAAGSAQAVRRRAVIEM